MAKCICLVSQNAFLRHYKLFLAELYAASLAPSPVPLELIIGSFLQDIPVPHPPFTVQFTLPSSPTTLRFTKPILNDPLRRCRVGCSAVPIEDLPEFDMKVPLMLLDDDIVLLLLRALLLERNVLLLSSSLSSLCLVAEAMLGLLYPFAWQHLYIPMLPHALTELLHAPVTYFIGTCIDFVTQEELDSLHNVVVINLAENKVRCQTLTAPLPKLPIKEFKIMAKSLRELQTLYQAKSNKEKGRKQFLQELDQEPMGGVARTHNGGGGPSPRASETAKITNKEREFRRATAVVIADVLRDYRDYLIFPSENNPNPSHLFDYERFLTFEEKKRHVLVPFVKEILYTQAFQVFIESRITNHSHMGLSLGSRRRNTAGVVRHLIEEIAAFQTQSPKANQTLVVPEYDCTQSVEEVFKYPSWPSLQDDRFPVTRLEGLCNIPSKTHAAPSVVSSSSSFRRQHKRPDGQVVHAIWFNLLVRLPDSEVAPSDWKLDKAFMVLEYMADTGILVDSDVFPPLITACGKWGGADQAVEMLQRMRMYGVRTDARAYSALLQVFSSCETGMKNWQALEQIRVEQRIAMQAYKSPGRGTSQRPVAHSTPTRDVPRDRGAKEIARELGSCSRRRRRYLRGMDEDEAQELYERRLRAFTIAFPGFTISTEEICPECDQIICDRELRGAWKRDRNDYTSGCPACQTRFVARFQVCKRHCLTESPQSPETPRMFSSRGRTRSRIKAAAGFDYSDSSHGTSGTASGGSVDDDSDEIKPCRLQWAVEAEGEAEGESAGGLGAVVSVGSEVNNMAKSCEGEVSAKSSGPKQELAAGEVEDTIDTPTVLEGGTEARTLAASLSSGNGETANGFSLSHRTEKLSPRTERTEGDKTAQKIGNEGSFSDSLPGNKQAEEYGKEGKDNGYEGLGQSAAPAVSGLSFALDGDGVSEQDAEQDLHTNDDKVFCEYLSPRVLEKELNALMDTASPNYLTSREFRTKSPTLFWNLVWHLSNYSLPLKQLVGHWDDFNETPPFSLCFKPPPPSPTSKSSSGRRGFISSSPLASTPRSRSTIFRSKAMSAPRMRKVRTRSFLDNFAFLGLSTPPSRSGNPFRRSFD